MTGERSDSVFTPRVIVGLLIVGFGLALTFENLGWWHGVRIVRFWPVALMAIGLAKLLQDADRSGKITGGILLVVGGGVAAEQLFFLRLDAWRWWPIVIVLFGLLIVSKAIRKDETFRTPGLPPGAAGGAAGSVAGGAAGMQATMSEVAIWAGLERRVASPAFRRADLTAVMGGIELDLRQAGTEQGQAVVDVFVMWGGIEIVVPPDWAVSNQVTAIMGASEDKSTGTQQARNLLIVKGIVIMGGVEIKT